MVQDLAAMPSMWTTQAPHCDVSQPTCVPVSRRFSRRNCTSKVRASTSPVTALPFTVMDTAGIQLLPYSGPKGPLFAPPDAGGSHSGPKSSRFRSSLNPGGRPGQGRQMVKSRLCGGPAHLRRRNLRGKILEEVVGNLLGGAVDQALAELGKLTADLRLD